MSSSSFHKAYLTNMDICENKVQNIKENTFIANQILDYLSTVSSSECCFKHSVLILQALLSPFSPSELQSHSHWKGPQEAGPAMRSNQASQGFGYLNELNLCFLYQLLTYDLIPSMLSY